MSIESRSRERQGGSKKGAEKNPFSSTALQRLGRIVASEYLVDLPHLNQSGVTCPLVRCSAAPLGSALFLSALIAAQQCTGACPLELETDKALSLSLSTIERNNHFYVSTASCTAMGSARSRVDRLDDVQGERS